MPCYISLFDMNKLITLSLFLIISYVFAPNLTPSPQRQNLSRSNRNYEKIRVHWNNIPQIILFGLGLAYSFWILLLLFCNQVNYVSFNTNLILFRKKSNFIPPQTLFYLLQLLLWLLLCDQPEDLIQFCLQFLIHNSPNSPNVSFPDHNISKRMALIFFSYFLCTHFR